MSAFKQSMRKLGVRAGLLAGTSLAVVAIAGVGASSASAACSGTIEGQGSSLQKVAQTVFWNPEYKTAGCPGGGVEATYTSTSSGKGMGKWGLNAGAFTTGVSFVGTDDGPTTAQMEEMRKASAGKLESEMVVVPVAQTAISVVYNPPTGCKMPGNPAHITNANLEKAFDGEATSWAAIGAVKTANGAEACPGTGNLTRVVRAEGSGTTFQFKNYLAQVNKLVHGGTEAVTCTGQKKWSELETIGAEEKPNITWPECGTIAPTTAAGGGGVASKVATTAGTIGYAALPDAKANSASVLAVQNNGVSTSPSYKPPYSENELGEPVEEARCFEAEYTVPAAAREVTAGTDTNVEWTNVFGGQPSIGGEVYPICTLTYDLGWHSYEKAGFGATIGGAVKGYYEYILSKGTGTGTSKHWYANLPKKESVSQEHDVHRAATYAVTKIGK